MTTDDRRTSGFKDRTRLDAAVDTLLSAVESHERTERLPLNMADGRAVASTITAPNPVPNYDRAAMDGFAVRAADTFGAGDRSPKVSAARTAKPSIAARS